MHILIHLFIVAYSQSFNNPWVSIFIYLITEHFLKILYAPGYTSKAEYD